MNSIALNAFGQLRQLVNQQRGVNFDIPRGNAETWLLNTFLDEASAVAAAWLTCMHQTGP